MIENSIFNNGKPAFKPEAEKLSVEKENFCIKAVDDKININDKLVRIIGIQFFGVVIPNATGLVTSNDRSITYLMLAYGYFILISFFIWQGNRWLLFRLEERYNWFINPAQKIIMILGANVFYTAPLVVFMLLGWYRLTGGLVDWGVIKITAVVCVICVIFITHIYETVFLIKQRESDKIKGEKLERARVQAELEALKNQIDPHFMFNSLNSLSYLIDTDPSRAKEFTQSLAEVYRYILSNKDQRLVILQDELLFLDKYLSLLYLRFDKNLQVLFNIEESSRSAYLIPPISIFIALENVVKHNEISQRSPMQVEVNLLENYLRIANKIKPKKTLQHSSKIGLTNLDERFKIITGMGVNKVVSADNFELQLPMLPISN
ncbi:signal transduction histidine kinase, LytS [Fulvivirga imtechensis AK7]|uniref:Signal transduction histidine kinase, LytS n=1 Tax=Fulvivirga imtechensis AK7 TaxID=1237149 RepID=L8JXA2_9BACT|nr:sensor histidine kinase [Fulvivirga imtechensis]ELR72808.1 signal transduction histidine kinase, LytS [Fulvivirga imtechensis AK7]